MAKFLENKKWTVLGRRLHCPYGEVDLLFEKENKIALIEVKYLHDEWMIFERVHPEQLKRLSKNLVFFQSQFVNKNIKLFVALVDRKGQIKWIAIE